jgi:hypothetical protein
LYSRVKPKSSTRPGRRNPGDCLLEEAGVPDPEPLRDENRRDDVERVRGVDHREFAPESAKHICDRLSRVAAAGHPRREDGQPDQEREVAIREVHWAV